MNPMIKTTIVAALVTFGSITAMVPVAEAGKGGSPGVIRSAIRSNSADAIIAALEQSENIPCNSDCMEMVMKLLEHDEYEVRQVAAWWFARRPAQMRELAEQATTWLNASNSVNARNGADILGTFGYAKYIPVLSTAAVNQTFSVEARAASVQALGHIGNMKSNAVVAQAMTDKDAAVRLKAVVAWKGMLKQTTAAPVAGLVKDTDLQVRRAALGTVGSFRVASARVDLEAIVLNDPDPAARRNAAWALGRIGDAASKEVLRKASTDASGMVRMTAKVAMSKLR